MTREDLGCDSKMAFPKMLFCSEMCYFYFFLGKKKV